MSADTILSHRRADQARHEYRAAVLEECLGIAMRSLAFAALPTTRVDLRLIRDKLQQAGIGLPQGIE